MQYLPYIAELRQELEEVQTDRSLKTETIGEIFFTQV